jgi:hypothetical protein
MALLLTSVFGVTGCGSDDDVQAESRIKNAAPEASAVSDDPSEADCGLLDRFDDSDLRNLLTKNDLLNLLDRSDFSFVGDDREFLGDLYDLLDLIDILDFSDLSDLRYQCSGTTTVSDAPSKADCDRLDLIDSSDLISYLLSRSDRVDLRYLIDLIDDLDLVDSSDFLDDLSRSIDDFGFLIFDRSDLDDLLDRDLDDLDDILEDLDDLYDRLDLRDGFDSDRSDRSDLELNFLNYLRDILDDLDRSLDDLSRECIAGPNWTFSVTTTTVPYVDEVPPCAEGREVENSEECLD